MFTERQLGTIYEFMNAYIENPRISERKLHRHHSMYRTLNATCDLLHKARDTKVLIGPRIYCNSGVDVDLIMNGMSHSRVFDLWKEKTADPQVTYAVFFVGAHAILSFKRGASVLAYAETIKPSFPAQKRIENVTLTRTGRLERDPYPHDWDELDWKVYHALKEPHASFVKVGENLGVVSKTVENRFRKILKYCKVRISFFPRGYDNYLQTFLTFGTDYEIGLREELQKLDRTTYLYKFEDRIMLNLFVENGLDHNVFLNMEKEGLIHDLHVSIPQQWHKSERVY